MTDTISEIVVQIVDPPVVVVHVDPPVEVAVEVDEVGMVGPAGLSAYQLAVEYGFEGTEEEWVDEVNAAATVATAKAQEASEFAETAGTKAGEAGDSASAANTAANTATVKAEAADADANAAAGSANTANNAAGTATTKAGEANTSAIAAAASAGTASSAGLDLYDAVSGIKDLRRPVTPGTALINPRFGAICIPFTLTGLTSLFLDVEVDLCTYNSSDQSAPTRMRIETGASCPGGTGLLRGNSAHVRGQSLRAGDFTAGLPTPRVRWIRESNTTLWLVIGDVGDGWTMTQALVHRVVAPYNPAQLVSTGVPRWLTTLPTATTNGSVEAIIYNGTGIVYGTGAPNFAADPGTEYVDRAATAGAVKWIKKTGVSASGWAVSYGDTDVRDVGSLHINGWTNLSGSRLRRTNDLVEVRANGNNSPATTNPILTLPVGFRPYSYATYQTQGGLMGIDTSGNVASVSAIAAIRATMLYTTRDAWPTSLPGTAA